MFELTDKQKAQEVMIAEIFAIFEKTECNIIQPENSGSGKACSWVQVKPLHKDAWYWPKHDCSIKTLLFYFTTYTIMVQGGGKQEVFLSTRGNFLRDIERARLRYCRSKELYLTTINKQV